MTTSAMRWKFRKTHRRISSMPHSVSFPTLSADTSYINNTTGSGGESDDNQRDTTVNHSVTRRPKPLNIQAIKQHSDNYFSIDVAELVHSPTFNRRSVSTFSFQDVNLSSIDDQNLSSSTPATMSLKPKLHHSVYNVSMCTSSTESLREDHRSLVLKELLKTERHYINSLENLINVFLPSLADIMSPRDIRLLFPCQLEPLIALHHDLLSRLDERIEGRSRFNGIVGDIFGRLCSDMEGEFVTLYSAYMNEFKVAMQILAQYENTSPLFCKTASNCSQQTNCEGLSLAAYLLTPIQRIPRYELLLKELIKHTSQDHPDCYYIEAALDRIHSALLMLNRSIQACQLACTIQPRKRPSQKRRRKYTSVRLAAKLKRHLSQTNIDDYSSPGNSPRLDRPSSSMLEKQSVFAKSEMNLHEKDELQDEEESERKTFFNRAISVSDVFLLGPKDAIHDKHSSSPEHNKDDEIILENDVITETLEETIPEIPIIVSRSPSITSQDSVGETHPLPILLDTNRASVYSSNSSTSGFDSLLGTDYSCGPEDSGTLKNPTQVCTDSTSSNNNSTLTLKAHQSSLAATNSTDSGYSRDSEREIQYNDSKYISTSAQSTPKQKKRSSLTNAFKMLRKAGNSPLTRQKRSKSLGQINRVEISEPSDFRHIQHGFSKQRTSVVL